MKLNITSHDPIVIAEFILVGLATLCFIGGMFAYLALNAIPVWNWFAFTFFILLKNWLEFFESVVDRRIHQLDEHEMPFVCRRQAD